MYYSIANPDKYKGIKKDIIDSLTANIECLFETAHIVEIRSEGGRTYLRFDRVDDNGVLAHELTFFDSKLFCIPQ